MNLVVKLSPLDAAIFDPEFLAEVEQTKFGGGALQVQMIRTSPRARAGYACVLAES